jgi:hypothetical protein
MQSSPPRSGSGSLDISHKQSFTHIEGNRRQTVGNLVSEFDVILGVDDDLLLAADRYDLCRAIGITTMIDQPAANKDCQLPIGSCENSTTNPRLPFLVASTTSSSPTLCHRTPDDLPNQPVDGQPSSMWGLDHCTQQLCLSLGFQANAVVKCMML